MGRVSQKVTKVIGGWGVNQKVSKSDGSEQDWPKCLKVMGEESVVYFVCQKGSLYGHSLRLQRCMSDRRTAAAAPFLNILLNLFEGTHLGT